MLAAKQALSPDVPSVSLQFVHETHTQSEDSQALLPSEKVKAEGRRLASMPQLQGAQALLQKQLQAMKDALEAELRERQKEAKVSVISHIDLPLSISQCEHSYKQCCTAASCD